MDDVKTQWHPGFVAAVDLELSANRNDLIYEKEYNLNFKPLSIDLLVIKKNKNIRLKNEIGRLFRYIKMHGINITNPYPGIYYLTGNIQYNLDGKYDQELADAVFTVSANANQRILYHLKGDESMRAVLEFFKPEIDKILDERVEAAVESAVESVDKAARQKEMRIATNMYQLGINIDKIAQAMEYPVEVVREWIGLSADVS